jgi:hypothetical protein
MEAERRPVAPFSEVRARLPQADFDQHKVGLVVGIFGGVALNVDGLQPAAHEVREIARRFYACTFT